MKYLFNTLIIFLLLTNSLFAGTFTIGDKAVEVPNPDGFEPVTTEMDAMYRLTQQMIDPQNDQLAYYIPAADISVAISGETPVIERYFILKVGKKMKKVLIGTKDFNEFKSLVKQQNEAVFETLKKQAPELMEQFSDNFNKEFDRNIDLKMANFVPLEPHRETDNSFSYSAYLSYDVAEDSTSEKFIVSSTSTFINASGKVLFLYTYGEKDDLEWTRTASREWEESILAINSAPPTGSTSRKGFDLIASIKTALVGAILGGLVILFSNLYSRFKKKKQNS